MSRIGESAHEIFSLRVRDSLFRHPFLSEDFPEGSMHKNSRAIELCPDPRNVQAFRSLGARVKLLQHVQKVGARQAKDIVEQVAIACENSIDEVEYRPRGQELVIPQVSMQQDIKDFFTNFRDLQQIEIYGKLRLTVCSLIGNEERSVGLGSDQPSQ